MSDVANGRIDLAAPLLSVRRRHAGEQRRLCDQLEDEDAAATHGARGGVPFGWERSPGHPKSVRTFRRARAPPPRPEPPAPVPEAARFSEDALSRADSCFTANCSSVNGLSLSDAATGRGARGGGVMMDRFLQAAKALVAVAADGVPPHQQPTFRKAPEAATGASAMPLEPARRAQHHADARAHGKGDSGLPRRLLVEAPADPVHVQPDYGGKAGDTEKEEWEDAHSTAGFAASRRCGLLPTRCAKGAGLLLLLNSRRRRRRHSERNPLLPRPRDGQRHAAEHSASMDCMQTWEEVYISSLLRSDRRCRLIRPGTLASELDSRLCVTDQAAGGGVHRPKATTHLGMLLVLDRTDDEHHEHSGGKAAAPLPPPECAGTPKAAGRKASSRNNAGLHGFPPLLQENAAARRRERDAVVARAQPVLVLPSPKSPSESWLSRALLQPSVSNKPPPTSEQHRKEAPSPWCSGYQTKVAGHGRVRHIRIYDLHK